MSSSPPEAAAPTRPHAAAFGARRRRRAIAACVGALLAVALVFAVQGLDARYPPPLEGRPASPVVLAADGTLLRAFTDPEGRWRLPVALGDVDGGFIDLLIAYEDQRFRTHPGVDPLALVRASAQAARHGRIVSGASTLTMQTVRLLSGDRERSAARKLSEMVRALQLERRLGKDEILTRYLNHAPYGGNIEGIRAAALAYFGREPARLTLAQSALLIALPQSPEARRPDRHPAAAARARNRVLARLEAAGAISARDADEARRTPVPDARRPVPRLAPHLARRLVAAAPERTIHPTHLNATWQAALEDLTAGHVNHVGPRVSAAIVVAELQSGEIRASVGSAGLLAPRRAGHVDMTEALRSPGSTLKPFIYGLAMEAGLIAPATLLADKPTAFGAYQPGNFDNQFRGLVTADEALRLSLNIPAVTLLNALGPVRLAVRLREAGAAVEIPKGKGNTLALGLGGFGTRLTDLAQLYTALARDGRPAPLHSVGPAPDAPAPLMDARSARRIAAILTAMRPPANAKAGEIAYKTGTSYGHRDAWAVGFDARHVVAVWIGRPDGTPVAALTGWTDAAPLLFDAFARIGVSPRGPQPGFTPTAELPPPLQAFGEAKRLSGKSGTERSPITIAFPPPDAHIALTAPDGTRTPLTARVMGAAADAWLLNGRPLKVRRHRRTAELAVPPGRHTLTVISADGAAERVTFTVE